MLQKITAAKIDATEAEVEARKDGANEATSLLDEAMQAAHHHNAVMKDWHATEHAQTAEGKAATAAREATERDLVEAFKIFDADANGTLTADELKAILQRPSPGSTPMSDADIAYLIECFDGSVAGSKKDGMLDVNEFIKALTEDTKVRDATASNDTILTAQYQRRFDENVEAITVLFKAIDTDNSGYIDVAELEPVATLLHGEVFIKDDYLAWYDLNGKGDGKFDLKEFGWCAPRLLAGTSASASPPPAPHSLVHFGMLDSAGTWQTAQAARRTRWKSG